MTPHDLLVGRSASAPEPFDPVVTDVGMPSWSDGEAPMVRRFTTLGRLRLPVASLVMLMIAAGLWLADRSALALSLAGVVSLTIGFACGIGLLRWLLSASHPVIGVARAIVDEAVGTRLSLLLVVLVVVSLPMLPLLLDPSERLAYRMQFFLTWSLSTASVLLSLVTIALCCSSVAGDIDTRRIHMALAKPMGRGEYMLGKWLGVVLLDLLLVGLVGLGVYAFAAALARSPAADAVDRIAVDEQVLTARASARPTHPRGEEFERSIAATIEQVRSDDPSTFDRDPVRARKRIVSQRVHEWHTVTADVVSSFVFDGLHPERIRAPVVQLRLEPFADNSMVARADVRFALWLNERPFPIRDGEHVEYAFTTGTVHTVDVPTSVIAADGTLRLTIANRNLVMPGEDRPTTISFTPGEGLEVLYRVGGFGGNIARGLVVLWAKLTMLAATALAAAAWLGFPTALLTSLMVYVTAVANGFLADAIDIYTGLDRRNDGLVDMLRLRFSMLAERTLKLEWWEVIKTLGSYVADGFLSLVPSFGAYDSITQMAGGRVVAIGEATAGAVVLGVAYPLVLLALGWMLLERRDLVRSAS